MERKSVDLQCLIDRLRCQLLEIFPVLEGSARAAPIFDTVASRYGIVILDHSWRVGDLTRTGLSIAKLAAIR